MVANANAGAEAQVGEIGQGFGSDVSGVDKRHDAEIAYANPGLEREFGQAAAADRIVEHGVPRPEILYWRTVAGEEVDFVIEWQGRLLPIEVKATAQPRLADARSLLAFRREYPDLTRPGLLLHAGVETGWIADGVLAAPWWRVV